MLLNKTNKEIGKLMYEKQLFEMDGNVKAADRIEKIIKKIRDREVIDEKRKDEVAVQSV